jgi:hypothetical protein
VVAVLINHHNVELEDVVMLEVLIHQKEIMVEKIIHHHHLLVELEVEVELVPSDLMHQEIQVELVDQEQMLVVVFHVHQIQEFTQVVAVVVVFADQIHLAHQVVVELAVEVVVMLEQLELQTLAVEVVAEDYRAQQEHMLLEQQADQE